MGRPLSGNRRYEHVVVRMSAAERLSLERLARAQGLNYSVTVRRALDAASAALPVTARRRPRAKSA